MFSTTNVSHYMVNYVNNRAKVLEETENEMSQLIVCPLDDATCLASDTAESGDPAGTALPTKKAKGLSKVLGHCLHLLYSPLARLSA